MLILCTANYMLQDPSVRENQFVSTLHIKGSCTRTVQAQPRPDLSYHLNIYRIIDVFIK